MRALAIGVLTGRRPELLDVTLGSFVRNHTAVWELAAKVVFHNGGDDDTAVVLDRYDWDRRVVHDGQLLRIGEASQHLGALLLSQAARLVLRLEDDWECNDEPFLDECDEILRDPLVGQVRLQTTAEQTRPENMVTKRRITWEKYGPSEHLIGDAHYTHRPSLMRAADYAALFPYRKEIHAMRRFHGTNLKVVQHNPGVFTHIGWGDKSLKHTEGAS